MPTNHNKPLPSPTLPAVATIKDRLQTALRTYDRTGNGWKAAGSFLFPSSMTWSGRSGGGFLSVAPRNFQWRNADPLDNSAVMACLAWSSRNFGQAPLRTIRERRDGKTAPVDVTGFLDLLYNPNPFYSAYTLWCGVLICYHTMGDAYILKVRNARGFGTPTGLWFEPTWSMKPHWPEDGSEFIDYYERRVNGRIEKWLPGDVIHLRNGVHPANPRHGFAPLRSAMLEVFTDSEAALYTAALLKNMAIPGVVVNPRANIGMTAEKAEAIKQRWTERFGGDNKGQPLILDFEADVTTLGFSPADMDYTNTRHLSAARICSVLGVPMAVAGIGGSDDNSQGHNNLIELKKTAFEENLVPTWKYFAEELTRQLLRDFTNDPNVWAEFDTSGIEALKENEDAKTKRILDKVRAGVMMVNQAQEALGHEPDPAATYYLIPSSLRPVTAAVALERANQTIEDLKPAMPANSGDDEKPKPEPAKTLPPVFVIIENSVPQSLPALEPQKAGLLPALPAFKSYEWEGLTLRREPTELEKLLIKQIEIEMETGKAQVAAMLASVRAGLIEELAIALDGLAPDQFNSVEASPTNSQREYLLALLAELFRRGAFLIVEELTTQGGIISAPNATPDEATLNAVADATLTQLSNDVRARAIASAAAAVLLGLEVADKVRIDLGGGSTGYVDRSAASATNVALARGRAAEIQSRREEISEVIYSAVLDASTCAPCGEADGVTGQPGEIPNVPNPDCKGGGNCRCVHIPVRFQQ